MRSWRNGAVNDRPFTHQGQVKPDGRTDGSQEAIHDEHRVKRQALLGHCGGAAHVDKHADDVALFAHADARGLPRARADVRRKYEEKSNVVLAGGNANLPYADTSDKVARFDSMRRLRVD